MRFNIISVGLRIVTLQAMVQDLLVAGEVGLQLSDVEIGNPGGLSSGMGRAAKATWGWLPNVCWISSCCLPCPQLWFQNSCQLPHQHNPLPGKWYRLGTMYDLPEQYARLESHGFIPLCFWRKKDICIWQLSCTSLLEDPAELQKSSSYFVSRNEEIWVGFV